MSESTSQETPVATQKRPLDDSSSPSCPTGQPDAKRPALDKVAKDESDLDTPTKANQDTIPATDTSAPIKAEANDDTSTQAAATAGVEEKDKHGDTIVPDAQPNGTASVSTSNGKARPTNGAHAAQPYHNQDETNWLHLRAIIGTAEAATVIGKGGENVSQIRRLAGAKCTVSEYTRGAIERILTVSGNIDAVAKAFGLIARTVNQEDMESPSTPQSKTYPLRLLIPHILIGSIIGKQGIRIREIQEQSGARVNASESCLPLSSERSLVVLGVADAIHIATYYIGSTLIDQLTERFGGPAASNYASRTGGPHAAVPGGMMVVPYVPQHIGGKGGPDVYRAHNQQQPQRSPSNPYAMPYLHGPGPQPQAPAPVHYGTNSPRAPYGGVGPQQAQPYGQPGPQAAHGGPPPQAMPGMPGMPNQITQQIYIPNDMVGAIIGKGGAKINEIRQLSGSVIKINEPQDNSNERLVTVAGTQESNQMALYMLYSRLGESSKNSNAIMPR